MPASLKKRFLAALIDYGVIVLYIVFLAGVSLLFYRFNGMPAFNRLQQELVSFGTLLLPVTCYFVFMEGSSRSGSIGKNIFRLYLCCKSRDRCSYFQLIIRNIVKLLPWQLAHSFIFSGMGRGWEMGAADWIMIAAVYVIPLISVLLVCLRRDRRSLHDLAANTRVFART
ncbi:RDD family protein [Metabacillus sp. GX 13764]|uniref:RDD family protein n=1 Tax=Metabacillus kandeliae TaxID=2900151 RepID=UPI001E57FFD0|nr:RDD family protein [Metabacillus kandeliae]MCD7034416.1 RDD family protein [Metabacillus kandeliae]